MATALPESTYAVLGLVDKVPDSSGYDLAAVAYHSLTHFWPISQTLLYRELDRLTELGWVAATRVEQVRAPGKWTYRTTDAGQHALSDWLAGPVSTRSSFRSGFLLRFFFAYRMDQGQLRSSLEEYRLSLQAQRDEFEAIANKLQAIRTPEARAGWLTALHGLRTVQARLGWTDEVEAALGGNPP